MTTENVGTKNILIFKEETVEVIKILSSQHDQPSVVL